MQTILMPIGDAAEVLDTYYPLFRLKEEGYRVLVAGPQKRPYHLVLHERPDGWDITQERPGYTLEADIAFHDVDTDSLAGMVITGGRAPEYLRYDADLIRITKAVFAANKPVASVCHGIEILAAADVIRGREATTVAKFYVNREVVVSGNLVTCRTWHDNPAWMREYLKLLRNFK
jgi:protease I